MIFGLYQQQHQVIELTLVSGVCAPLVYCSAHLLSLDLTLLENMDEPLQLVSRIGGIDQQPKVFSCTEIHVEGDHPQTRLNLHCVETSAPAVEL